MGTDANAFNVMDYAIAVTDAIEAVYAKQPRVGNHYELGSVGESDKGVTCEIQGETLLPDNSGWSVILAEVWYNGKKAWQVHEAYMWAGERTRTQSVTMHANESDAALDYIGRTFPQIAIKLNPGHKSGEVTIHDCAPGSENCWC